MPPPMIKHIDATASGWPSNSSFVEIFAPPTMAADRPIGSASSARPRACRARTCIVRPAKDGKANGPDLRSRHGPDERRKTRHSRRCRLELSHLRGQRTLDHCFSSPSVEARIFEQQHVAVLPSCRDGGRRQSRPDTFAHERRQLLAQARLRQFRRQPIFNEYFSNPAPPFGRPKCDKRITFPPASDELRGASAGSGQSVWRPRLFHPSIGRLRSTRTRTRFDPATSEMIERRKRRRSCHSSARARLRRACPWRPPYRPCGSKSPTRCRTRRGHARNCRPMTFT